MSPMPIQTKIGDASLKFGPDWLRALSSDTGTGPGVGPSGGGGGVAGWSAGSGGGGGLGLERNNSSGGGSHGLFSSVLNSSSSSSSAPSSQFHQQQPNQHHNPASSQQQQQQQQQRGDRGNNNTPPNINPNPNKFKQSEHKYSREEMLALYDKNLTPPLYLPSFGTLFVEKMQPPLAFSQPSEEEIRIWHIAQPESSRQGSGTGATQSGPGRGGSYTARGRGTGIDRGRGRGRGGISGGGSYYARPHEEEDRPFNRPRAFERSQSAHERVWAERNGAIGSGGPGGPLPADEGAPRGGSWRSRGESYGGGGINNSGGGGGRRHDEEDSGWRTSKSRWRREDEEESPRGPPNQRRLHKSWSEDGGHDSIPEWARDNPCEESGTFDASGAFHGEDRHSTSSSGSSGADKTSGGDSRSNERPETSDDKSKAESEPSSQGGSQSDRVQKRTPERNDIKAVIPEEAEPPSPQKETLVYSVSATRKSMTEEAEYLVAKLIEDENTDLRSSSPADMSSNSCLPTVPSIPAMVSIPVKSMPGSIPVAHQQAALNTSSSGGGVVAANVVQSTTPSSLDTWLYRDPQGSVQGPFTTHEMAQWYSQGYFSGGLLLRRECDSTFISLADMCKLYKRNPFLSHPDTNPPPPITDGISGLPSALEHLQDPNIQSQFQQQQQLLQQSMLREQQQHLIPQQQQQPTPPQQQQHLQQQQQQFVALNMAHNLVRKDENWQGPSPQQNPQLPPERRLTQQELAIFNLAKSQGINVDSMGSNALEHIQAVFQRQLQIKQQQQQQQQNNEISQQHASNNPASDFVNSLLQQHQQQQQQQQKSNTNIPTDLPRKSPVSASQSDPIQSLVAQLTQAFASSPTTATNFHHLANQHQHQKLQQQQQKQQQQVASGGKLVENPSASSHQNPNNWGQPQQAMPGGLNLQSQQQQQQQQQQQGIPWMPHLNNPLWEYRDHLLKLQQRQMHEDDILRARREKEEELKRKQEEEEAASQEVQKRLEEARRQKEAEEEKKRKQMEEQYLLQQRAEQQQRLEQQRLEQQRLEQQQRVAAEQRRQKEAEEEKKKRKLMEEQYLLQQRAEQQRAIEHQQRLEQQRASEQRRQKEEDEKRKQMEEQYLLQQRAAEQQRLEHQQRLAQQQQVAEQRRQKEAEDEKKRKQMEEQYILQQRAEQQRAMEHQQRIEAQHQMESSNNSAKDFLSIIEIQQEEALKIREEEMLRQQMLKKQQLQQQEQQRQQQQQQPQHRLKWATQSTAAPQKVPIKSLTEIQAEEQAKLTKQQEKERQDRQLLQQHHQHHQAWSSNLTWANRASLNAPNPPNKTNGGGGVWDDPPLGSNSSGSKAVSPSSNNTNTSFGGPSPGSGMSNNTTPRQSSSQSSSVNTSGSNSINNSANSKRSREAEDTLLKLFQDQLSPQQQQQKQQQQQPHQVDEFTRWCYATVENLSLGSVDIPTFVGFLKEVESPYDVGDYVRSYLGDGREAREFSREFLERRSRWKNGGKKETLDSSGASNLRGFDGDTLCRPASAINPSHSNNDFQEVKAKGKKGKKGKMQKVDSRILGFNTTAAPDRLNVGKRDYGDGAD